MHFTCNLCGSPNHTGEQALDREQPSCAACGSNLRMRALIHALSLEIFGVPMALPDFPRLKSLRALGASDSHQYAARLAEAFDYRNTFYDHAPQFDIADPPAEHWGQYDFLIVSEVFEHIAPPVERAFQNCYRLLKPAGLLLLSVPYSLDPATAEHFPDLAEFGIARVGDKLVLVNRTRDGRLQLSENVVFHRSGPAEALEMREFSQDCLIAALRHAGFSEVHIHAEAHPPFGVVHPGNWSLPIAARKGTFTLGTEAARELVDQWNKMMQLRKSRWVRLGNKLGVLR